MDYSYIYNEKEDGINLFQELSSIISKEEIEKMVEIMVDNYDKYGYYYDETDDPYDYDYDYDEEVNQNNEKVYYVVDDNFYDEDEIYNEDKEVQSADEGIIFDDEDFYLEWLATGIFRFVKEHIKNVENFEEYLNRIISNVKGEYDPAVLSHTVRLCDVENYLKRVLTDKAMLRRAERHDHWHNVGDKIDLNECKELIPFNDNYEFFKDGAWGIATKEGIVLCTNHFKYRPSQGKRIVRDQKEFVLLCDRDSNKFGVLSLRNLKEIVPCAFDHIDVLYSEEKELIQNENDTYSQVNKFVFLTNEGGKLEKNKIEGGKFGCYSRDGYLLLECNNEYIHFFNQYLECFIEDDFEECYDSDSGQFYKTYVGRKELFDLNGSSILRGYNYVDINENYISFYFKDIDKNYNLIQEVSLVVDKQMTPVINCGYDYKIPKGLNIHSAKEATIIFDKKILLFGRALIMHISEGFLYCLRSESEEFILSEYINHHHPVSIPIISNGVVYDIFTPNNGEWVDHYFCEDEISIIRLDSQRKILWTKKVNEIGRSEKYKLYRIGTKIGKFDENGLCELECMALSIYNRYYAVINKNNSNLNGHTVLFYENKSDGSFVPIQDKAFNPFKESWFPYNFKKYLLGGDLYSGKNVFYYDDHQYYGREWNYIYEYDGTNGETFNLNDLPYLD